MDNTTSYTPEVKKGIINLLMFTMYSEPKTIYREYVQNALDSVNNAIKDNILIQAKDGIVNIQIDKRQKQIIIKDNGTGICAENATRTLLDISASTKDGVNQAGQFGIGRLVGGGYCQELIFRTSAKGETTGTKVRFDAAKIWKMLIDSKEYSASEVLAACTESTQYEEQEEDHYFEVILNGVKEDSAPTLLDKDEVVEYLNAVAPVGYTSSFKNTLIYKSTSDKPEYKELHEGLEKIKLFVNDTLIQKQYGLTVKGTKDEIDSLEYFKIVDSEFGDLGWGWFALTKYTIQIPKSDNLACIRLRKHNIQIGDNSQLSGTTYWKEERSNSYFYGEFFVTHRDIVPNGARDGLAPSPATNALNAKLREYFEDLKKLYTQANTAKKSIDKIKEGIDRLKKNGEDYKTKDLIENNGIAKFDRLLSTASFGPIKRMLELYRPAYEEAKANAEQAKNALTPTNANPQQEAENTVVCSEPASNPERQTSIQERTSPDKEIKLELSDAGKTSERESGRSNKKDCIPTSSTTRSKNVTTPATDLFVQKDIITPLKACLEDDEICMIRRVFNVLNANCPNNEHDKKLVSELERLIVKEFSNGN